MLIVLGRSQEVNSVNKQNSSARDTNCKFPKQHLEYPTNNTQANLTSIDIYLVVYIFLCTTDQV